MEEIWKDIPNYEGLYQVSNLGKVKSLSKFLCNNSKDKFIGFYSKEKILKPLVSNNGYSIVTLYKNKKKKTYTVHKLIASAFFDKDCKLEINHIDGNKQNNSLNNLEAITHSKNILHNYYVLGIGKSLKPVLKFDKQNNFIKEYDSIETAGKENKICSADICKCCKQTRKTAGGYIWKYKEVM